MGTKNTLEDWKEGEDVSAAKLQAMVQALRSGLPISGGRGVRVYSSPTQGTAIAFDPPAPITPDPTAYLWLRDLEEEFDGGGLGGSAYLANTKLPGNSAAGFLDGDDDTELNKPNAVAVFYGPNGYVDPDGIVNANGDTLTKLPLHGARLLGRRLINNQLVQIEIGEETLSVPVYEVTPVVVQSRFRVGDDLSGWLEQTYVSIHDADEETDNAQWVRVMQFGNFCETE